MRNGVIIGVAIGIAVGLLVGLATGAFVLWLVIGVAVGTSLGAGGQALWASGRPADGNSETKLRRDGAESRREGYDSDGPD